MLCGRGGRRGSGTEELLPNPEEPLRVNDVLVVVGTPEDINQFRRGAPGTEGAGRLT